MTDRVRRTPRVGHGTTRKRGPRLAVADESPPDAAERAARSVGGAEPVAIPTKGDVLSTLVSTLGQGQAVARETGVFARELLRIARGRSSVQADAKDWRFAEPAWRENPVYKRMGQTYLSLSAGLDHLADAVEQSGRPPEKARFAVSIVSSAIAPTNTLLGNPAALKKTLDTGGMNLARGLRNWVGDVRHNGGMPSMANTTALKVGRDLALTPGAVVQRDEYAELLQYTPTTKTVAVRPVLIVPPPIGRYYFLDMSPKRSFVEYAAAQGLQTFILSWRNPGPSQRDWSLDTYAARVLTAVDAVREITGSDDVNVSGFCAGGVINTGVLNHLAAAHDERIHGAAYAVTLLDFAERAPIQAFSNAGLLAIARGRTRKKGVISARDMGAAFTWMRPNDLVWNYWVNNYLMGEDPPIFDILAWNADGTNLSAELHLQFLDIFAHNSLCDPGAVSILGSPVDLSTITVPTFVVGALTDHLTPWKGCYRTTQLLSGPSTFVLSHSGHIQSLVNPPGNPKALYYTGPEPGPDPDGWRDRAEKVADTWWAAWARWMTEQGGRQQPARQQLGSATHPPLTAAPGDYVSLAASR
jgi:polyhydroxyalkanoate synthase subunit PhaC